MDFQLAWDLYQKHYSPEKISHQTALKKSFTFAKDLLEIADHFDALLLDGFGVLNIGVTAIEGMPETLNILHNAGKSIFVLTNGGSMPSASVALKYPNWGYPILPSQVISSRDALKEYLHHFKKDLPDFWGVIGAPFSEIPELQVKGIYLDAIEDDQNFDKMPAFLFLGSMCWNRTRQNKLINSLKKNPRMVMVANPDMSAPLEEVFTTEPGTYANELEAIAGVKVLRFGKPFQSTYDLAYQKINEYQKDNQRSLLEKHRILMVGDTLHTDILGGNAFGMKTALMTDFGFLRMHPLQEIIKLFEESNIAPDFILTKK